MGRAQKRPSLLGTLGGVLFVVALVLLYWYLPELPDMTQEWADRAYELMGVGLALPAFFLLVLLTLWRLGRLSALWRRTWLALLAFSLAGWEIATLSNPQYGGEWGQRLLGPPTWIAFLRLAVLLYLGFILLSPGLTLSVTRRALLLLERPFLFLLRLRLRRPRGAKAPVEPSRMKEEEQEEAPPKQAPKPSTPPAPARLKKVVMEVWRK